MPGRVLRHVRRLNSATPLPHYHPPRWACLSWRRNCATRHRAVQPRHDAVPCFDSAIRRCGHRCGVMPAGFVRRPVEPLESEPTFAINERLRSAAIRNA
jgi:hypothetical protein